MYEAFSSGSGIHTCYIVCAGVYTNKYSILITYVCTILIVQALPVVKACNWSEKDDVRLDLAGGQQVLRELTLLALLVQKSTNTDRGGVGVYHTCAHLLPQHPSSLRPHTDSS